MKIVFIAPRYHTNQVSIIRTLKKRGVDVIFYAHYIGATEDHSDIVVDLIKPSLSRRITMFFRKLFRREKSAEEYGLQFNGSFWDIWSKIKNQKPDLVIVRGKGIAERKAFVVCKLLGVPIILYNQEPLYKHSRDSFVKRFLKTIYNTCVPKVRYTPVLVDDYYDLDKISQLNVQPHAYHIPFAIKKIAEADDRTYSSDGIVRFLMVGKFREYKNHRVLIDALSLVKDKSTFEMTLLGQCADSREQDYLNQLKIYVTEKGLSEKVKFVTNINPKDMSNYYLMHDVLILPTKKEDASIAVLEAMHHGMSVISTSKNGTASYLRNGGSGYIFKTCDAEDLAAKIQEFTNDPSRVALFGKQALIEARGNSSPDVYISALNNLLQSEFPKLSLIKEIEEV